MTDRVVIILGAGASRPLVPTTSDLLPRIISQNYGLTSDTTQSGYYVLEAHGRILNTLWHQIGRPPSFEAVLNAALDQANSSPCPSQRDTWINAATEAAQLIALCIMRSVSNRAQTQKAPIVQLLNTLGDFDGRITVGSLNWDDLVLRISCPWYDGYDKSRDNTCLDGDFFTRIAVARRRLLWLHGSIHLNRRLGDPKDPHHRTFEFRWHNDSENVLRSWVTGTSSQTSREILNLPIVMGGDKTLQILRRPFFDYWSVLYQDLLGAQTLALLGYSGQDGHLNSLVTEALRANPLIRRIIWVGWEDAPYQLCPLEFTRTLFQVTGLPQYAWGLQWDGQGVFRQLVPICAPDDGARFVETWICLTGIQSVVTPSGLKEWHRLLV